MLKALRYPATLKEIKHFPFSQSEN